MIKFLVNLTTLVVSIFIIFLCCEGALRAKYGFVKNNADSVRPEIRVLRAKYGPVKNNAGPLGLGIPDNELGWIPNENLLLYVYDEIFTHKELNKHGFRVFGDVRSTKKKFCLSVIRSPMPYMYPGKKHIMVCYNRGFQSKCLHLDAPAMEHFRNI